MTTGVNRLKELLFEPEAQRLADVQRRIDALSAEETARHQEVTRRLDAVFERAGTEDRMLKSVATVIDGALREAEVTKHDQLSRAVAPLVVKTIKYELKNSQDEMVDALYPLTGRLVKQYVQAAMADLMADINRRLGGAKPSELEARAKALGLTVPELVLQETQSLKVDELFLVRRGSGDLVAHWERPEAGDVVSSSGHGSNRDVLIAGYLSGITSFSEEAFDDKKGSLRSLDMDGERIFVRASPAYLIAARCSGSAPQSVERIIDDEFVRIVADVKKAGDGAAVDQLLPNLAGSLESRFGTERKVIEERARLPAKKPGMGRLYAIAALVLLPLIGWIGWSTWQSWQTSRVQAEARRVLVATGELRGYPLTFDVEPGGRALTVGGLTPNEGIRAAFLADLRRALPDTRVTDSTGLLPRPPQLAAVAPMPTGPDLSGDIGELRRELAALRQQATDARSEAAQARQRADAAEARLGELRTRITPVPDKLSALEGQVPEIKSRTTAIDAEIRRLEQRIDGLPKPAPTEPAQTPRDRLNAFIQANAIFFGNGTDYYEDRRANDTIDRLVELIRADDSLIRVVGYTDERGGQTTSNAQLATSRADRVAQQLIARGVPRDRLTTVGRVSGAELSRLTGVGSPNRRVVFELGYIGEPTP